MTDDPASGVRPCQPGGANKADLIGSGGQGQRVGGGEVRLVILAGMAVTVGVFSAYWPRADFLLNMTERSWGREGRFRFVPGDRSADVIFVFTEPVWPKRGLMPWWRRHLHRLKGDYFRAKSEVAYRWLGTPKDRTFVLLYEPPSLAERFHDVAAAHARVVWSPSEHRPNCVRMPAWWMLYDEVADLRASTPQDEAVEIVAITTGKRTLPGHVERQWFLRRLREVGVPLKVFGHGVAKDLDPLGPVESKGAVLKGARLTLALENTADGDKYVTEKLWDPLLSWSLPIYYGSGAADSMIPGEAFIRLPNLGEEAVEIVRAAVADPQARTKRLGAMAEARRRVLDEHRLPKWLAGQLEAMGY